MASDGIKLRPMCSADYDHGVFEVLSQLTSAPKVEREIWDARFKEMEDNADYIMMVADLDGRVVGCGSLIVERKLIRNCGLAGHIEDIVVDSSVRKKGVGALIVNSLAEEAERIGCYKVILDCSEANEPFYLKGGFDRKGLQMVRYFGS